MHFTQNPTQAPSVIDSALDVITRRLAPPGAVELAVVSGSGLGILSTLGREVAALPYGEIPGLGGSGVAGHASRWILAESGGGRRFYCLLGRRHLYEGIDPADAGLAMRLLGHLGVKNVILTNAAGGLGPLLYPGELMLIRDHLDLMFRSAALFQSAPAFSDNPQSALRAPRSIYDPALCERLRQSALDEAIGLKEGVYAALCGPCYETRAEAALLRRLGAEAVGMSTVPEVLAAQAAGLRVAAVSLITNSHWHRAGPASHDEVLMAAARSGLRLRNLLARIL